MQKMTSLVLSVLIANFFTGNENLFRPLEQTWKAPGHLHGILEIEEVSFLIKMLSTEGVFDSRKAVMKRFLFVIFSH